MKKIAVTLVELIISLVLLSIVVLGAISFSIATTEFLGSSEKESEVLNDLTYVLDHIQKHVLHGIGDQTNTTSGVPSVNTMAVFVQANSGCFRVRIRQDISSASAHSQFSSVNFTPWDYTDDRFIVYEFNPTNAAFINIPANSITVRACQANTPMLAAPLDPGGVFCTTPEVLTAQLVLDATNPLTVREQNGGLYIQNLILSYNTASYNPLAPDERLNPTISISQQFFYNYSQSLN